MKRVFLLLLTPLCLQQPFAIAQVVADTSLGTNVLEVSNSAFEIDGGRQIGTNLFHSFDSLSIPAGGEVNFLAPSQISFILARITSTLPSNISGRLSSEGTADLFIINRNGIRFGPRASISIGGSFFATTANSLGFDDQTLFSVEPSAFEDLTSSVPVSLKLTPESGKIQVEGMGQEIFAAGGGVAFRIAPTSSELKLSQGKTFALIGNQIEISNGVVTSPSGQVELASVLSGTVGLEKVLSPNVVDGEQWSFSYPPSTTFNTIRLSRKSLIDVSGNGSEGISLYGSAVELIENAKFLNQNQGINESGDIAIRATNYINIGVESTEIFNEASFAFPLILSEVIGLGSGGQIKLEAPSISIEDGSAIASTTFSEALAADITIRAEKLVRVSGGPNTFFPSIVTSQTFGPALSGNVEVSTERFEALAGGRVTSSSFGTGKAGSLKIVASDEINLIGTISSDQASQSNLASDSFNTGDSGSLLIETRKLRIANGADIATSAYAEGNAGDLNIIATESVEIDGVAKGESFGFPVENPSLVASSSIIQPEGFRLAFGLPEIPSGGTGSVTIHTPKLTVSDGAAVTVASDQSRDAGSINIDANRLILQDSGQLNAATAGGDGGNINLISKAIGLTGNSSITTNAANQGNGGNITINSDFIVAPLFQDNNISANADKGNGGNVAINTLGLLGLDAADEDLPTRNDITATSETGLSGTVAITNLNLDPVRGITARTNPLDITKLIANSCLSESGRQRLSQGRFIAANGRGGLPELPEEPLVIPFQTFDLPNPNSPLAEADPLPPLPFEANGIHRLANGDITLGRRCA